MTVRQRVVADVRQAIERLTGSLSAAAPTLSREFWSWILAESPQGDVESYFLHPDRFPFLTLPYWIMGREDGEGHRSFLADLTRSSVSGYCYLRLLDDLLDEAGSHAVPLLPASQFLQLEFLAPYWDRFPPGSDVRDFVGQTWIASAEWAFRDARLTDIEESDFLDVCSRKMSATRIPVFATCRFAGVNDRATEQWLDLVDALAAFEQFIDDFFDWHIDLQAGRTSYLLSEAARRTASRDAQVQWLLSDGMDWARSQLAVLSERVRAVALALESKDVQEHLAARWRLVEETLAATGPAARSLAALRDALEADH